MKSVPLYKSFAFISYSHKDMAVAKWLQRRLESFKLPSEIHNDIESGCKYLRPIFRDQSDLSTGVLSNELHKHLEQSKYLIIICSKHSAKSKWVSNEARAFMEMGRLNRIIPFIIPDGDIPEQELFPVFLQKYFNENPDKELLGVNIGEIGKEKAVIRVVACMLNVSFDSLWQRHLRHKRIKALTTSLTMSMTLFIIYMLAIPIRVSINVGLQKTHLPIADNVVLNVDGGEYTAPADNPQFDRISIPGYKRFSDISISAHAKFFQKIDTMVKTGFGLNRNININLSRDNTFSVFAGNVYDSEMNPLEGVEVSIINQTFRTDADGAFRITVPLPEQRQELPITLVKEGFQTVKRLDEVPCSELKYIMYKR